MPSNDNSVLESAIDNAADTSKFLAVIHDTPEKSEIQMFLNDVFQGKGLRDFSYSEFLICKAESNTET
jgi:hypothetical protein